MTLDVMVYQMQTEIIYMQADLRRLKESMFRSFYKRRIESLSSKIDRKDKELETLSGLKNSLENGELVFGTETVQNELEPMLRKLGFYLIKRDIIGNIFEHTYKID